MASDSMSYNSRSSKPKLLNPNRYQFEPPESIAEESPGSIQQSAKLNVRALRRSQSNLTINSQQRLIEPEQFSTQTPWNTQIDESVETGQIEKLRKSVSAASMATVKRFWKRDHFQLPGNSNRVKFLEHDSSQKRLHRQGTTESRDFSSSFTPTEIVIQPQRKNPRVGIMMKPESPLSIGRGILHGRVEITIDAKKESIPGPPLGIGYLSVDLVGVESCSKKYHIFQSLAVDLIDPNRSPPAISTTSISASHDGFWDLLPSVFSLPFQLQLPEDPGPPPYRSRHGSIRYILSATAIIRIGPEETFVRDTCSILILGPHNPRISLVNLPEPLTAMDTFVLSRDLPLQDITLRASLNRDVWAAGMSIFVDVHVRNRSLKLVNKLTISLERVMMVYHHPVAQLDHGYYRQSRLPDKIYRKSVTSKNTSKSDAGWRGIPPNSRESKTWMLDLPATTATINTGRFFGVRYFLKVSLHLAYGNKNLSAQLPITILNPNSLDITSEFEAHSFPSSRPRPRPSTMNSDLPPALLKSPYRKRVEHQTPPQGQSSRQRRETWAWVSEVSPHPSLVPSPLLPSYGVPSKSGRTPSRLRMENRISLPPIPHVPERLRPPLGEQSANIMNRGDHHIHTSGYPMTSTEAIKSDKHHDHDPRYTHQIGPSTIVSLQAHIQESRNNNNNNNNVITFPDPEPKNNTKNPSTSSNPHHPGTTPVKSPRRGQRKSPFKFHRAVPHRRAISRSRDVRAIYRPLSKDAGGSSAQLAKYGQLEEEGNGWETVENFF